MAGLGLIAAGLLLAAGSGYAQAGLTGRQVSAPVASKWPVERIAIEGNRRYGQEQILAVAGLQPGSLAGREEFEAARERLLETGAFESIAYRFQPAPDGKGYVVTFEVAEVEQVYPFRSERLPLPEAALQVIVRGVSPLFRDTVPATDRALRRCAEALEKALADRGTPQAVVARLTADTPDRLVIVFQPAAPPPVIAEVRFRGNQILPELVLRNAISGVAVGLPYSETRMRQLLENSIRPLYEARGRLRVAFPSVQAEKSPVVDGVVVTVEVSEGETYALGEVSFAGEGVPLDELREAAAFHSGEPANFSEIAEGLERIRKALGRRGYLRAGVELEREIRDERKTVDLRVRVSPGPQFTFGKLIIQGLDINAEAAVRRLWTLKPGAPFDASYPDLFLERIREDGVFDNLRKTKSVLTILEESRSVDVTLIFG
ncbi:MAG TPA: POTRA domain-containing protein [Bryobacteraceae bacterium]|nr:POTRA domain-containing protein [Bryobacteraceae bacterium]